MTVLLDTFIRQGTGTLPRLIRLNDGPGYWLSVTSTEAPDGTHPEPGQYVWFDVVLGEYVIAPDTWKPYTDPDTSTDFLSVPSHLVRALIAEHSGEQMGGAL